MSHVGKGNAAGDVLTWDGTKWVWAQPAVVASVGPFATIDQVTVDPLGRIVDFNTTGLDDGTTAWVNSVEANFMFDATSVLAADGITVVAPLVGPGRWFRIPGYSVKWVRQVAWFVGTGGDDENSGLVIGSPLLTLAELSRRISGGTFESSVVVTLLSGFVGDFDFDYYADNDTFFFQINGNVTSTAPAAITAVTPTNPGAGTRGLITTAATVFVDGTRLRLTTGANTGALAWVTRIPGANQANTNRWALTNPLVTDEPTLAEPAIGNNVVTDTLNSLLGRLNLSCHGAGTILVRDCTIQATGNTSLRTIEDQSPRAGVYFYGCRISPVTIFHDSDCLLVSCSMAAPQVFNSSLRWRNCVITGGGDVGGDCNIFDSSNVTLSRGCCFDGAMLVVELGATITFTGGTNGDCSWVDNVEEACINCFPDSNVVSDTATSVLWGANNVVTIAAVVVRAGSTFSYVVTAPQIAGGGPSDTLIGAFLRPYAALPFNDGSRNCGIVDRPL